MSRLIALGVVATNPIQYQVPLWQFLSKQSGIALKVYYCSDVGLRQQKGTEVGTSWVWDFPLLEGYDYEFVPTVSIPFLPRPSAHRYPTGLSKKIRSDGIDTVLVNGYMSGAAWGGIRAASATNARLIMRADSHERFATSGLRPRLRRARARLLVARVDAFAAIGTWNEEYWNHIKRADATVHTGLYGVDNERFQGLAAAAREKRVDLRRRWNATTSSVVFLFVGQLIERKGVTELLRSFARVCGGGDGVLVFVGTGPLEDRLRSAAEELGVTERVTFEGFAPPSRLPEIYAAADILVLPSAYEPWGLVVNEAMACGIPAIVSSRVGAGPDLIAGKNAGAVFEYGESKALEKALRASLNLETREMWTTNVPAAIQDAGIPSMADAIMRCALEPR